ncbi:hypothetical protein BMF35_a2239 [Aurantiacibacter gangjinensis]|nr:hypothetical protein BMF35_a2239 [Aurantiacibacter gangjinensis]
MDDRQLGNIPLASAGWLENILWVVSLLLILVWAWAVNRIGKRSSSAGDASAPQMSEMAAFEPSIAGGDRHEDEKPDLTRPVADDPLGNLDQDDLAAIQACLNEVANGTHLDDGELLARTGFERDEIRALLERTSRQLRLRRQTKKADS